MKAPKLEHAQLSEDHVRGEALRPSRGDFVPPPQKVPYPFPDVVIDRPIRHEPRSVGEVLSPPTQDRVELRHHLFPRRLVGRTKDLADASLDPFHRLLRWPGPQVPVAILPVMHGPEGVAQEGKRLAPPIAQPGLLLVERQAHLHEPPAALREHLRSPIPTQDHEVSRPGESHPRALAEPYVNVSAHTAPIIQSLASRPEGASARRAEARDGQCHRASVRRGGDAVSASCISSWPTESGAR
jgi:hypothetical protein